MTHYMVGDYSLPREAYEYCRDNGVSAEAYLGIAPQPKRVTKFPAIPQAPTSLCMASRVACLTGSKVMRPQLAPLQTVEPQPNEWEPVDVLIREVREFVGGL